MRKPKQHTRNKIRENEQAPGVTPDRSVVAISDTVHRVYEARHRQINGRCGFHGPRPWSGTLVWKVLRAEMPPERETGGSLNHTAWCRTGAQHSDVRTLSA